MAFKSPIYARYSDNVLLNAVVTGTAPLTTYSLATFLKLDPGARVRFGSGTVTVTFTVASAEGAILCIPSHNLDPGTGVVTLTNGAGFSQGLTIPAKRADGFPPTLLVDLTALSGTRVTTVWNLVIVSNSVNVILGGCIAIYGPKRSFLDLSQVGDYMAGSTEHETQNYVEAVNEYMTPYVQEYGTVSRSLDVVIRANAAGAVLVRDWFRKNVGGARPGLFWPDPNVCDGYFGRWPKTLNMLHDYSNHKVVNVTFDEWPKGLVI